jgi:phospholipid-binding lipoprotein MlaA
MYDKKMLWVTLFSVSLLSSLTHAENNLTTIEPASTVKATYPLKDLKNVKLKDFKIDAKAAQPDEIKDPLQPFNRKVFAFNEFFDRTLVRPLAVQYTEIFPAEVRGAHKQLRSTLHEPWNAVNQTIQGRPVRALKSLGRLVINAVTTLGLADPARRLGLEEESESFGTTLAYYGVPTGPYLVVPVFGPSSIRDGFGLAIDSFGRPQNYLNHNSVYWTDQALRGVDARSQLLPLEDAVQGDKYAVIRDIYLQHKSFVVAEKQGLGAESISFVDDATDEIEIEPTENNTAN